MDTRNGSKKGKRGSALKYFYLNGDLHKRLHVQRGADILTAWNYPQRKRVGYSYTDVKRRAEKAFKTVEAAKMLNRTRLTLEIAILEGNIPAPQKTYSLTGIGKEYQYLWSEQDIINMHEYLQTVHKGRPRKDGLITPMALPSARELRAMIREDRVLYTKTDEGTYVPSWKAEDI